MQFKLGTLTYDAYIKKTEHQILCHNQQLSLLPPTLKKLRVGYTFVFEKIFER